MLLKQVKMLLDIGRLLGEEKMFTLVKPEEARDIWLFLAEMDVDVNVTSQGYCGEERAKKAYYLISELVGFGWKTINALKEYCRGLYFKNK